MLKDVVDRGDARVMAIAIRELRLAYKLFQPYAEKRKVTMFGSARTRYLTQGSSSAPVSIMRVPTPIRAPATT